LKGYGKRGKALRPVAEENVAERQDGRKARTAPNVERGGLVDEC